MRARTPPSRPDNGSGGALCASRVSLSYFSRRCVQGHKRHFRLEVGDVYTIDLSPLELQNAGTKQAADKIGARRLEYGSGTEKLRKGPMNAAGPSNLTAKSQYSTTLAKSTLRTLIGRQQLRRGDGLLSMPASRRNERLFGATGTGRSKCLSKGIKLENLGKDYSPREDTCVKACVRMLAVRAAAEAASVESEPL